MKENNYNIIKVENKDTIKSGLMDRCFSKINEGSFRSALISTCIFSLGPIIISIPYKFSKIGLIYGWLILLICAIMNYITMYILLKLATIYKIRTYTGLIRRILGKNMGRLFDIFILFTYIGVFTLYFVICKIKISFYLF